MYNSEPTIGMTVVTSQDDIERLDKAILGLFGKRAEQKPAGMLGGPNDLLQLLLNSVDWTAIAVLVSPFAKSLWDRISTIAGRDIADKIIEKIRDKYSSISTNEKCSEENLARLLFSLEAANDPDKIVSIGISLPTPPGEGRNCTLSMERVSLRDFAEAANVIALFAPKIESLIENYTKAGFVVSGDSVISKLPDWSAYLSFFHENGDAVYVAMKIDYYSGDVLLKESKDPLRNWLEDFIIHGY